MGLAALGTYFGSIALGLVLSLITRRQPRRRYIQIATAFLAAPIILVFALFAFLRFTIFKEPPTLSELRRDFPSKRADLETILRMSDEDGGFSRIAPTFVDRKPDNPNEFGRYMKNDPRAGLPRLRWEEYQKIYTRAGIKAGIQRNYSRDAFIMVDSVGLLNRGHTSGYLHCAPTSPANADRFYPCMLNEDKGARPYNRRTRDEAYSFQKLANQWYAYDVGPS